MTLFVNSKVILIRGLIVLVILMAGGAFGTASADHETQASSENPCSKSDAANFTLTSHMGSKVSVSDYKGKMVVVLFGYTHCPDVCPTQLNDMQKLLTKSGDKSDQVQVLFVTFDPERDTPKVLKEYLAFLHPTFVGLTGTKEEIASVARQFRAQYIRREVGSEAGYMIAHSSVVYLLDQQGQLHNIYFQNLEDSESTIDEMAEDMQQLIKKGSKT